MLRPFARGFHCAPLMYLRLFYDLHSFFIFLFFHHYFLFPCLPSKRRIKKMTLDDFFQCSKKEKKRKEKKGRKEGRSQRGKKKIRIQIKDPRPLSLELKSAVYLYPSPLTLSVQPGKRALEPPPPPASITSKAVCDTATKITWNNVLVVF